MIFCNECSEEKWQKQLLMIHDFVMFCSYIRFSRTGVIKGRDSGVMHKILENYAQQF